MQCVWRHARQWKKGYFWWNGLYEKQAIFVERSWRFVPKSAARGKGEKEMWPPPLFYIFLRGIDASFDRGEGKGDLGAREGKEEGAESTNKMNADRKEGMRKVERIPMKRGKSRASIHKLPLSCTVHMY